MKLRIQLTPALTVALLCAAGWFAFWLLAFRPALTLPKLPSVRPGFVRLSINDKVLNALNQPTRFALPSAEGFSGGLADDRMDLRLTLEKPTSPALYLPRATPAAAGIQPALLLEKTVLPKNALPLPGVAPRTAVPPATGIRLFFSPELTARGSDLQLNLATAGLPETVRVNLAILPDGRVAQAFFETPVTNAALLSAVRQLQFKPAKTEKDGWVDIRFAQEGAK